MARGRPASIRGGRRPARTAGDRGVVARVPRSDCLRSLRTGARAGFLRRSGRCPGAASRSTSVPSSVAGSSPGGGRVTCRRPFPTRLDQTGPSGSKRRYLPSSPCRGAADADISRRCRAGRRMRKSQTEATMSLIEASGDTRMTCSAEPLRYALYRLVPTTVRADLPGAAGGPSALLAGTDAMPLSGRHRQSVRTPPSRSWARLPPQVTPSGRRRRSDGLGGRRGWPDHVRDQSRSVGPSSMPPRRLLIGLTRDASLPRPDPPTGSEQGTVHP